jgi:hypothetical protein
VRALGHGQPLDGSRPRAKCFQHGLDAEDVRAVVLNLMTPGRFARLAFREAWGGGAALGPAPKSARHTVSRRLVPAPVRAFLTPVRAYLLPVRAFIMLVRVFFVPVRVIFTSV